MCRRQNHEPEVLGQQRADHEPDADAAERPVCGVQQRAQTSQTGRGAIPAQQPHGGSRASPAGRFGCHRCAGQIAVIERKRLV